MLKGIFLELYIGRTTSDPAAKGGEGAVFPHYVHTILSMSVN